MSQPEHSNAAQDIDAIRGRIASIRERRGYVLPSHAVLAAAAPALLEQYEAVYNSITFDFRALTPFEKNFVWLVVIGCAESPTGAHHLADFIKAGGTPAQVEAAAQLAMLAVGGRPLEVIAPGWQRVLPEYSGDDAYARAVALVGGAAGLPAGAAEMALAAGHACRRDWKRVEFHIVRAKAAAVTDEALAEALTVCILPAGNPAFVQSCGVWRTLILEGKVPVSPGFRAAIEAL
ncbi:MAG: hypothetical protein ABI624_11635 [Casimicrobiaceae bacterium]